MESSKRPIQYTPYKIIVAIQNMDGHIDVARKNMSNVKIQPTKVRISMVY